MNFIDAESGISHYLVSVGTSQDRDVTDVVSLTQYGATERVACFDLTTDLYLQHGITYYTTVWALNSASKQQNVSRTSNGSTFNIISHK